MRLSYLYEGTGPKEYSVLMAPLPKFAIKYVKPLWDLISKADLLDDGIETEPHITIKYGLHTDSYHPVKSLLHGERPFNVTLGKTSIFKNEEFDVVKLSVYGNELFKLNALVSELPHTDTYPDYKPHLTIAYVKSGCGDKYAGIDDVDGMVVTFSELVFSDKFRNTTFIDLV